jgi:hypothetical protein
VLWIAGVGPLAEDCDQVGVGVFGLAVRVALEIQVAVTRRGYRRRFLGSLCDRRSEIAAVGVVLG